MRDIFLKDITFHSTSPYRLFISINHRVTKLDYNGCVWVADDEPEETYTNEFIESLPIIYIDSKPFSDGSLIITLDGEAA